MGREEVIAYYSRHNDDLDRKRRRPWSGEAAGDAKDVTPRPDASPPASPGSAIHKAVVVAFAPGDWVMRYGEATKIDGEEHLEVFLGRVTAIQADRRRVRYRVKWSGEPKPRWCDGTGLESVDDEQPQ